MIDSKIMSGKDILQRLNFEGYFADCKNVLVICDLWAQIFGAKSKIKKAFGKDTKVTFIKVKASNYAETTALDKCLQKFNETQADMVVTCGSQIACNLGKALKYSTFGTGGFEDFCKINFEKNEGSTDRQAKQIKLVHLITASGDHAQILTGAFDIFDKKEKEFFRFCKKISTPDVVMADEKLLDKLSLIGMLGIELSILATGLVVLIHSDDDIQKMTARTAIKLVSGEKIASRSELYVADMTVGNAFLGLKNNLFQEVVFGIQRYTDLLYYQTIILLLKNSFQSLVDKLCDEEIKLLGSIYQIDARNDSTVWKQALCGIIQAKLDKYFEDKDIICSLNEAGLNSEHIEEIFEELQQTFGQSEILSRLKDLTYAGY